MKPCSKNRKRIAFLALDALDARKAVALRSHFAVCEGCRRYSEEISTVTKKLAASEPASNLEASSFFHHAVSEKLQAAESISVLENLPAWFCGATLNWRVTLPTVAALAIALLAVLAVRHPSAPSPPATTMDQAECSSRSDLPPTIANYQIVAAQSLEKLDELLARQGNKPLPPAPVYTASGLVQASF